MGQLSKRNQTASVATLPNAGVGQVNPHAAGVDISAHELVVCVGGPDDTQQVRTFGNYTADLQAVGNWLQAHQIETVAMESTGIYWIPLYDYLESQGITCCLVNARSLKQVPGRKTDIVDSQWIQTLHSYGLLRASFRPTAEMTRLRTLLRHRQQLIEHRMPHVQHIQKAMLLMNVQLPQVLSDVMGLTGQRIIRAIVAGERDPKRLAALRDTRCHKEEPEIELALTGTWQVEQLFIIGQSLALYDAYTEQLQRCDAQIEQFLADTPNSLAVTPDQAAAILAAVHKRPRRRNKNSPYGGNVRGHLQRIAGVDIVAIPGVDESLAQTIITEIGIDMSKFPSAKHFCSWLGLAPKNEVSGGRVLRSHVQKTKNRAGQAFRLAARAVIRSDNDLGAFYRRLKSKLGPAQALVATAHRIARIVYHMLTTRTDYQPMGAQEYEQRFKERQINYLQRKAAKLGFVLAAP